jgi:hypothetical protein
LQPHRRRNYWLEQPIPWTAMSKEHCLTTPVAQTSAQTLLRYQHPTHNKSPISLHLIQENCVAAQSQIAASTLRISYQWAVQRAWLGMEIFPRILRMISMGLLYLLALLRLHIPDLGRLLAMYRRESRSWWCEVRLLMVRIRNFWGIAEPLYGDHGVVVSLLDTFSPRFWSLTLSKKSPSDGYIYLLGSLGANTGGSKDMDIFLARVAPVRISLISISLLRFLMRTWLIDINHRQTSVVYRAISTGTEVPSRLLA